MIGDQADFVKRIKATLPLGWFSESNEILDSVLSGIGSAWSWLYSLIALVSEQTRIGTASGVWLELVAKDYFGLRLLRYSRESDNHYRQRILAAVLRERTTRTSMAQAVLDLTGRLPKVFEPGRCADTGGYGLSPGSVGGLGYNTIGGWGNLNLPFQCFITAYRPIGTGIGTVTGWGCSGGGYGVGNVEYANIALMEGTVSDVEILSAISENLPVATIAWTRITD